MSKPVVVGISGASGVVMAKRTIDELLARGVPTTMVCSNAGRLVWNQEISEPFNDAVDRWRDYPDFETYGVNELHAPIASGTYDTRGMVIVPCSMNSVASLATGITGNLMLRSADVCLKERRPLVLVPRETPLHAIHLQNMTKLADMGVVILPPEPPFYLNIETIGDVVDFMVGRILVSLGIEESLPDEFSYQGPG